MTLTITSASGVTYDDDLDTAESATHRVIITRDDLQLPEENKVHLIETAGDFLAITNTRKFKRRLRGEFALLTPATYEYLEKEMAQGSKLTITISLGGSTTKFYTGTSDSTGNVPIGYLIKMRREITGRLYVAHLEFAIGKGFQEVEG